MVNQSSLQAIWALVDLANVPEGAYAGSKDVAKEIGARPNYLSKLLQTLARAGLLASQKGLGGGFRLARDPSEITLFDVVNAIDPVSRWTGCLLARGECSEESLCLAHDRWAPIKKNYVALLSDLTIADLVGHHHRAMLDRGKHDGGTP